MDQRRYQVVTILCPARVRTGGPEALHQLGRALLDLGHDVRIAYLEGLQSLSTKGDVTSVAPIDDPMPSGYARYAVPHTGEIIDAPDQAVVFPEIWPELIGRFNALTPHFWWLSVDNALEQLNRYGGFQALRGRRCIHLSQSYYGLAFLQQNDIGALPLFDYTAPEHFAIAPVFSGRSDRILYPARGRWFTDYLRKWEPGLNWQEISGFTPADVSELFRTSKVYADFGKHPGKDRMPREAAIQGCCILTGQRGSAANPFDVPIPPRYKFRDSRWRVPQIVKAIKATLADYEQRVGDFEMYRRMIEGERPEFIAQAARIFGGDFSHPWANPEPAREAITPAKIPAA